MRKSTWRPSPTIRDHMMGEHLAQVRPAQVEHAAQVAKRHQDAGRRARRDGDVDPPVHAFQHGDGGRVLGQIPLASEPGLGAAKRSRRGAVPGRIPSRCAPRWDCGGRPWRPPLLARAASRSATLPHRPPCIMPSRCQTRERCCGSLSDHRSRRPDGSATLPTPCGGGPGSTVESRIAAHAPVAQWIEQPPPKG